MEVKRYAARNVLVKRGELLHNGLVTIAEDGTIVSVVPITEDEARREGVEIREGYLCSGFVNAHTHSELSFLDGLFLPGGSMAAFLRQIDSMRVQFDAEQIRAAQARGYEQFAREGIVAYADISNDASTAFFKSKEAFRSVTFVEMFGVNRALGESAYKVGEEVLSEFQHSGVTAYMTPHATYSVSGTLWELMRPQLEEAPIFSLHYAETAQEIDFLANRGGAIYDLFHRDWGRDVEAYTMSDMEKCLRYYGAKGKHLLLVHCVSLTRQMLDFIRTFVPEATIVPCPESNLFIEGRLADYDMLQKSGVRIAVGTDSLSSSPSLSILKQLQVVNTYYPQIPVVDLLLWATQNGAEGCKFDGLGTLEMNTCPGLNFINTTQCATNSLVGATVHPLANLKGVTVSVEQL